MSQRMGEHCPNESGASWRSKASVNSLKPSKVSKPATVISAIRSQTPDAGGTAVPATVGVKLEEFSDILTSLDYFEGTL